MIKTDDLDAFVAVIRNQSLSQAADTLQLTQPAITRRVKNFEESLGVELLDRNTKPLKPTPMGTRVFEQCKVILREIDALEELVLNNTPPKGLLRIGVPQTIGDVVLLDALQQLKQHYPELRAQVANGWGSSLISKIENGELDAACALFPSGKLFPEGITGQSLAQMKLVVVAPKGWLKRKTCKLADCQTFGWVLNPDGCGFRAGLQRALSEQGLSLQLNLETFGTELQLGLVANGTGLGLVPEPLLQNSQHMQALDVINVTDFRPLMDLWLIQPRFIGNLQTPVTLFGNVVASRLARNKAA
ncbi:LysR family transcriptional regulator [Chromatiaceae bacterium AAb-1]|nr:LysR family transcriptional regulator [Chromatiaceae bacterium AAb-1]